jgi:pimeloyl-ACP methyl ester carboxylesterase
MDAQADSWRYSNLDGGAMSALFAATHPERVSALVLLSSFPRVRWATDYPGVPAEKGRW